MRSNSFVLCLTATVMLFGCGAAEDERVGQLAEPRLAQEQTTPTGNPQPISNDDDCTVIRAWVQAHRATLPTSYRELVRFPVAYRRAIFDVLSPAAKASLWREHFQAYLSAHPRLSERQVAVVGKLSADVALAFDATPRSDAAASLERLHAEAAALFAPDELPSLIAHLGPEDLSAAEPTLVTAAAQCECNQTSDWCRWGMRCKVPSCTATTSGCGTWWNKPCNGMCDW